MKYLSLFLALLVITAIGHASEFQTKSALINDQVKAIAYSGFREGQHPDRGNGAVNPSDAEILEDLKLLEKHGFHLIRLYDSGKNSAATLRLIKQHQLPIKVLLGIWLDAEVSNHLGCPWLDAPIPEIQLKANAMKNLQEIARGIVLAKLYKEQVVAVNVGNEALVSWNDHMVSEQAVINYVRQVKRQISQPVTVADNYEWWIQHGAALAEEVDFLGVHTYPMWENKPIEQALSYTIENLQAVQKALSNKPIAILEAGWASVAREFPQQANEANQARYFNELLTWSQVNHVTLFWFEAFDEPWKGNPANPDGAEKNWGLFNVKREPKLVVN